MKDQRFDPVRYVETELERDPGLWNNELDRKRLFKNAFVVSVGAGALLNAPAALARSTRPAAPAAVKTSMVAAQRIAATTLGPEVPGARSEVNVACYSSLIDLHVPIDYEVARKQLAKSGPTVIPSLAASWKANKDKTVWTFELQKNAKSSAGNRLQAYDVQWSADRWTTGSKFVGVTLTRLAGITNAVQQIKALTPTTVRITLPSTAPTFFLGILSLPFLPVYDSTELKKHATAADPYADAWMAKNTAGFGPYYVVSNSPTGDQTVLEVNKGFWNYPKTPKITKVTRIAMAESSQRLQLLLAGQADMADELTFPEQSTVLQNKNYDVTVFTTSRTMYLGMVHTQPPFDNPAIRRGIAQAVPYDNIIKYVYRGKAKRWNSVVEPVMPGWTDKYWKYNTNIAAAKAALAPLKGQTLTLSYPIGSPADEQTAILVQQGLKSAGVDIKLDGQDGAIFQVKRAQSAMPFYTDSNSGPGVLDPVYLLNLYYGKNPLADYFLKFPHRADVDALMAEANQTYDIDKVIPMLDKLQSILVPLMPIVPIAWTGNQTAHAKTLQGITPHCYTVVFFQDLFNTK